MRLGPDVGRDDDMRALPATRSSSTACGTPTPAATAWANLLRYAAG